VNRPRATARGGDAVRRAGLALALGAALSATGARARDLSLRADLTDAEDRTNDTSNSYFRQAYSIDWRRQFSQPISWRLSLQYQDDRGETRLPGATTELRTRILTPTASLNYRIPELGLTAAWRRTDEDRIDPITGAELARTIERASVSLFVQPFERADGTLSADRLAYSSDTLRTTDDRFALGFRYNSPSLRITNENRAQHFEDSRAGVSRFSMGPRVTAAYSRSFGDAGQVAVQYLLDYFRTEQTARSSTAVEVPIDLEPVAALVVVDDLPDDTPPMTPEPRLLDRDFDGGAGISLGPLGASFQNLAVDLGRVAEADELRIHARSSARAMVPFGDSVTWTVYSSPDGLRWAPVDGSTSRFDADMSAWVVGFGRTSARFFKAVNFGVNTVDTLVTELQAFVHETFQPDETRVSSTVRQSLGVTASARLLPRVRVTWSGQLNANAITPYDGPVAWTTDVSNTAVASFGPFDTLAYDLGASQTWASQAGGQTQRTLAGTGTVRWTPVERCETRLDARVHSDQVTPPAPAPVVRALTFGASAHGAAQLYPAVRASLGGGLSRQLLDGGGVTDFVTAGAQGSAGLTRDVELRVDASLQRTLNREGDTSAQLTTPLVRILAYEIYTAELRYRPSGQLLVSARGGYSTSPSGSGLVRSARVNWTPFPGGAVRLSFDYSHEIDPLSGQTFQRASAAPRWDVNRHAALELSYNMARGTGTLPVEQQNLYLTLSLRE
jgi:hypothetical protein